MRIFEDTWHFFSLIAEYNELQNNLDALESRLNELMKRRNNIFSSTKRGGNKKSTRKARRTRRK